MSNTAETVRNALVSWNYSEPTTKDPDANGNKQKNKYDCLHLLFYGYIADRLNRTFFNDIPMDIINLIILFMDAIHIAVPQIFTVKLSQL